MNYLNKLAKIANTLETAGKIDAANQLKKIATDFYKSALKELDIKNVQPIFEAMMENKWPEEKIVNSLLSFIDALPKLIRLDKTAREAALKELGWESNVPMSKFLTKVNTIDGKFQDLIESLSKEKQNYFRNKHNQLKNMLQKL